MARERVDWLPHIPHSNWINAYPGNRLLVYAVVMLKTRLIALFAFMSAAFAAIVFLPRFRVGLIANKDLFSVLQAIVATLAILVGATLSYVKFFMGRTISTKADIEFEFRALPTPGGKTLHFLKICFINRGNVAIEDPRARLGIRKFVEARMEVEIVNILSEGFIFQDDPAVHEFSVDVGEKVYFAYYGEFEKEVWAVSYEAEIKSKGTIWKNSTLASNV